ncbi:MAG: hypothetical protein OXH28_10990 [bacterium]|nr:hypothetical protein [bacterium]
MALDRWAGGRSRARRAIGLARLAREKQADKARADRYRAMSRKSSIPSLRRRGVAMVRASARAVARRPRFAGGRTVAAVALPLGGAGVMLGIVTGGPLLVGVAVAALVVVVSLTSWEG